VALTRKKLDTWHSAVAHQERLSARRGLDATIAQGKAFLQHWRRTRGDLIGKV